MPKNQTHPKAPNTEPATVESTDLDLCSVYVTVGLPMINLRAADGRTVFEFQDPEGRAAEIERQFRAGELELPADRLLRNLRQLKFDLHHAAGGRR